MSTSTVQNLCSHKKANSLVHYKAIVTRQSHESTEKVRVTTMKCHSCFRRMLMAMKKTWHTHDENGVELAGKEITVIRKIGERNPETDRYKFTSEKVVFVRQNPLFGTPVLTSLSKLDISAKSDECVIL